jgi:hypothetical protein
MVLWRRLKSPLLGLLLGADGGVRLCR